MKESRSQHHSPDYEAGTGNFAGAYHLEMIKDTERTGQICRALEEVLQPEGHHCDLGAGTGIFAIYAAQRCRKVTAVELDPELYRIAKENIARSSVADKITLLNEDALQFRPKERFDSVFVEMMSIWCIHEPQIPVMNHAWSHLLRKDATVIPSRIVNLVELGNYDWSVMGAEIRCPTPQFSGVLAPRLMTTSTVVNSYDLKSINPSTFSEKISVTTLMSGTINAARLSSLVQLSPSIAFYSTDSLMPLTIVPLPDTPVEAGQKLAFQTEYEVRTSLEEARFTLLV